MTMISFFPEPYPDELCYSLFARYRRRAGYRGRISTVRDLFGSRKFKMVVDLPSRLDQLIASLPPGHGYTTDRFIDEHTMLPFYGAFLSPERVALIRMEMGQPSGRSRARSCASVQFYAMRLEYLQYCPMCVEEDRERWGEAYWHRIHQASGVKVCPSHGVAIEPSGVNATYRFDREEFATLEESLPSAQARETHRFDHSDQRDEFHLAIARDARWLLDQRGLCATPDSLRRRYLNLLYDRGLATSADKVRLRVLRSEVESHYGRDFLESLGCGFASQAHIFNDLMSAEGRHARHPIEHLLFIHFLGCSARGFFLLPAEKRQPFGAPPWPCLNSASEHYRELRIEKCTIKDVHLSTEDVRRNSPRRPVGEFACDCGFVYRRIGPDTSEEDRYKKNWTAELGAVWESKLQDLRRNGGVYTTEALARRLNVNTNTLRRHEQRLGSCPSRENDGSGTIASPPLHPREQARLKQQEKRKIYREQWLSALEENPQIDLPTLKAKRSSAYSWLCRNDHSWLSARTPRRPRNPNKFKADWEARDIELSAAVRKSAARLMNAPGRPVQVSARAIGIDTGRPCLVLINDPRLPLTNQALMEVAESREAWAIRRIQWAVDCYRREGVSATRTDVLTRARVSAQFKTRQSILAAAEEGVRSLHAFLQKTD
jgi:hypothetical protein